MARAGKNTFKSIFYDLIQRRKLYKVPKSFPDSPDGKRFLKVRRFRVKIIARMWL